MRLPQILLVLNSLSAGGAEKQALLAALMLAGAGCHCTIYAPATHQLNDRIERLLEKARGAGVRVVRSPTKTRLSLPVLWRLWKDVVRAPAPTVVWSWGYRAELIRMGLKLFNRRIRSVVSLRSAYREEIVRRKWLWRVIDICRPLYLSNSHRNVQYLAEVVPGVQERSVVVGNALEEEALAEPAAELPAPSPELNVVMLGNIRVHLKGYDHVVELAAQLKACRLPVRIRIGGVPHEASVLRELIERADVADIVTLAGAISRPYDFLRNGHVFLLMSRIEGMPNSLLEAMSLGLPCISTRVGDVDRFARAGEHLRLVQVGDVGAVLPILTEWMQDWSKARTLGAAARQLCHSELRPEVVGKRLREIFEGVRQEQTAESPG